jgi:tRNA A64-2'-O-ribosylphosphate transferase
MSKTDELIFSDLATNFNKTLKSLRKSGLTITNRLQSIVDDSEFVCSVSEAYGLPLVANERCGSWYVPLDRKVGSAYFKSTDGHTSQWSFNLRRLNLQLFDVLAKYDGCVIVDSTRRGKSMPDALSKTVPIWCSVMNRVLFPERLDSHELYVPPKVVSDSEKAQIEDRLTRFAIELKELQLDITELARKAMKPLRPLWITRDSDLPEEPFRFDSFHTIVLCTSSRRVVGAEISENGYIQGAGDDNESWSEGLSPPLFWKHKDTLLNTPEEGLPKFIQKLIDEEKHVPSSKAFQQVQKASNIYIGTLQDIPLIDLDNRDLVISCGPTEQPLLHKKNHLHLNCRLKKLGSRDLRTELPRIVPFLRSCQSTSRIYVACSDGKDLSVGISLAIICLCFDEEGNFDLAQSGKSSIANKTYIKQRLSWITTSIPEANLSGTTLQTVNGFVFTSQYLIDQNSASLEEKSRQGSMLELLLTGVLGDWDFQRTLIDRNAQVSNLMQGYTEVAGKATFTQLHSVEKGEGVHLQETGRMNSSSQPIEVRRDWIWKIDASQPSLKIYFTDPPDSLYQEIKLEEDQVAKMTGKLILIGKALHPCIDDLYDSEYSFFLEQPSNIPTKFIIKHTVKGPKKDYVSDTEYNRVV